MLYIKEHSSFDESFCNRLGKYLFNILKKYKYFYETYFVKLQIKVDKFEGSHNYAPTLHIQVIQNITHANNTKYY